MKIIFWLIMSCASLAALLWWIHQYTIDAFYGGPENREDVKAHIYREALRAAVRIHETGTPAPGLE